MKKFLVKILKGIGIGISCIIPGVSGGTFALLTRCYDDLVNNISSLLKKFGKSFLALLPYGIGILLGVLGAYFGIKFSFKYVLFSIICLFDGMIIGGIYDIYLDIKDDKKTYKHFLAFIISFLFVIGIGITSFILSINGFSAEALFLEHPWYLYVLIFVVGVITSSALVTPGVSGAMILLVIGFYSPIINVLDSIVHSSDNRLAFIFLILAFILGIIVGVILISKLMKFLLEKHKSITYSAILGLVCASAIAIFLNKDIWNGSSEGYQGIIANPKELFLGIPLLIVGFILVFLVLFFVRKKQSNKE